MHTRHTGSAFIRRAESCQGNQRADRGERREYFEKATKGSLPGPLALPPCAIGGGGSLVWIGGPPFPGDPRPGILEGQKASALLQRLNQDPLKAPCSLPPPGTQQSAGISERLKPLPSLQLVPTAERPGNPAPACQVPLLPWSRSPSPPRRSSPEVSLRGNGVRRCLSPRFIFLS